MASPPSTLTMSKKSSIPFGNRKLDINFHECKAITFSLEKSYSTHSFPRIFPGEPITSTKIPIITRNTRSSGSEKPYSLFLDIYAVWFILGIDSYLFLLNEGILRKPRFRHYSRTKFLHIFLVRNNGSPTSHHTFLE